MNCSGIKLASASLSIARCRFRTSDILLVRPTILAQTYCSAAILINHRTFCVKTEFNSKDGAPRPRHRRWRDHGNTTLGRDATWACNVSNVILRCKHGASLTSARQEPSKASQFLWVGYTFLLGYRLGSGFSKAPRSHQDRETLEGRFRSPVNGAARRRPSG